MMKTVVAALIFRENELLICQRKLTAAFPGKWEFPGGKLEPGETPEAALRRELEEELGIDAAIGRELWRVEYQYPGRAPLLLLFFAVSRYRGSIVNKIFQQVCWAPLRELTTYDFLEADCALVAKLAAGEIVVPSD